MTPEEIERAAAEAVARFRARAGAIPSPPARHEIPPRLPIPYPAPAGRSCAPSICWCGGLGPEPLPGACAWWKPAPYDASHIKGTTDWNRKRTTSRGRGRTR